MRRLEIGLGVVCGILLALGFWLGPSAEVAYAGIISITGGTASLGMFNFTDYGGGLYPASELSVAFATMASQPWTLENDGSVDFGLYGGGDRGLFVITNNTGQTWSGFVFSLVGPSYVTMFYPGDAYTPGIISINGTNVITTVPYNGGSNGNQITASATTVTFRFNAPLANGGSFSTYLPFLQEGRGVDINLTGTPVPEPSLVLLLGLGLGAVTLIAWRFKG
jgi:hypothetical protein